jgi:hypothetical protein
MSVIVPPMDFTSSSVPVQMEFLFAEGCPPLPLDGALTAANSVSPVCRAESVSPAASEEVMGEVIVMSSRTMRPPRAPSCCWPQCQSPWRTCWRG